MGKLFLNEKTFFLSPTHSEIFFAYIYKFSIYRLDELLKRNCEHTAKGTVVEVVRIANANSRTSSNQSSHSPSVAGESLDVKVEITPAPTTPMSEIPNSFSIESTSSLTICSDISSKSLATSPNARKFSEIQCESGGFLNPIGNFNRLNPSPPNTASARLFKKLEEMIDLSLPYNHYRCLSPSETNLSNQLGDHRLMHVVSPNSRQMDTGKPGSSRLLRRQFSLDKDDMGSSSHSNQKHGNLETISSLVESSRQQNFTLKSQYQPLISSSSLPAANYMQCSNKLQNYQSTSDAQDLEKIEEINCDNAASPMVSINNINVSTATNDVNSFKPNSSSSSNNNNNNNSINKTPNPSKTSISSDRNEFSINVESSLGLR